MAEKYNFRTITNDAFTALYGVDSRRMSFKDWPFDEQPNAVCTSKRLSNAGFSMCVDSTYEEPCAQCVCCKKTMIFEALDNGIGAAFHRHLCPLIELGEKPESKWTLFDSFKLIIFNNTLPTVKEQSREFTELFENAVDETKKRVHCLSISAERDLQRSKRNHRD